MPLSCTMPSMNSANMVFDRYVRLKIIRKPSSVDIVSVLSCCTVETIFSASTAEMFKRSISLRAWARCPLRMSQRGDPGRKIQNVASRRENTDCRMNGRRQDIVEDRRTVP